MAIKASSSEEEYFAREEAEKFHKLHKEKRDVLTTEQLEAQKTLHYMHCPKCGHSLETIKWRSLEVEKCFSCEAIVLDKGELERLAGEEHEGSYLRSFFEVFSNRKS